MSARHPIYQLLRTRVPPGPDIVEAGRKEVGGEGRHYLGNQFQPKFLDKSLSMGHLETLSKYETKRSKTERVVKNCSDCHLWLTQLVLTKSEQINQKAEDDRLCNHVATDLWQEFS